MRFRQVKPHNDVQSSTWMKEQIQSVSEEVLEALILRQL